MRGRRPRRRRRSLQSRRRMPHRVGRDRLRRLQGSAPPQPPSPPSRSTPAAKASLLAERLSACGEAAHTKPHARRGVARQSCHHRARRAARRSWPTLYLLRRHSSETDPSPVNRSRRGQGRGRRCRLAAGRLGNRARRRAQGQRPSARRSLRYVGGRRHGVACWVWMYVSGMGIVWGPVVLLKGARTAPTKFDDGRNWAATRGRALSQCTARAPRRRGNTRTWCV